MNIARTQFVLAAGILLVTGSMARGQGIAVQQPVVQRIGVDTVVSVPDRGSLTLGGVNTAASGSRRSSLFGPGSTYGARTSGSSMSVHVTIHDFEAMDRALLQQGSSTRVRPGGNSRADAAYRQLLSRPRQSAIPTRSQADRLSRSPAKDAPAATDRGAFYLAKARRCEERGEESVAAMFYRMAARYGSSEAAAELAQERRGQ
ncbi:hypothetical protein Mal4_05960 [Maioricimonas rarisocia]|uniref:Uncharacterized protein n=1 Tax=Maioricimonas rarisocia TaxID=2528026 RepID=A0A517Z1F0_9PLAN|nr:hypothetical protein [Maioricimonas rarisocia]QDU36311.1 hypothetical protein Mal4_05960 [Maioricimonas rarisocia]